MRAVSLSFLLHTSSIWIREKKLRNLLLLLLLLLPLPLPLPLVSCMRAIRRPLDTTQVASKPTDELLICLFCFALLSSASTISKCQCCAATKPSTRPMSSRTWLPLSWLVRLFVCLLLESNTHTHKLPTLKATKQNKQTNRKLKQIEICFCLCVSHKVRSFELVWACCVITACVSLCYCLWYSTSDCGHKWLEVSSRPHANTNTNKQKLAHEQTICNLRHIGSQWF